MKLSINAELSEESGALYEFADSLRQIAAQIDNFPPVNTVEIIRDINGNRIGTWTIDEDGK